jgi:phosphoesterase RecJ-like protein
MLSEAAALIRRAERIALVTHVAPDPDAVGSALGLRLALLSLGKNVIALCDDPPPPDADFLPTGGDLRRSLPGDFDPDLFVALDASDTRRLGEAGAALLALDIPVLVVDHHVTNAGYGDVNVVDPGAVATAELVLDLIDALEVVLTPDIAACLMTGLVGDTRGFSTPNVVPATFAAASRLLQAGADVSDIVERVMRRRSLALLGIWGIALNHLHFQDGVIWAVVPYGERRARSLHTTEVDGVSSLLLSAHEAVMSAAFTEKPDGKVEVSMRARPGYDVAGVALALGGGGHALAAGCLIDGPLDAAVPEVVGRLRVQTAAAAQAD